MLSVQEARDYLGITGTPLVSGTPWDDGFQASQIVPLEWEHNSVSRCQWCNRKYFENQDVCAGCGAPI